MPTTQIDHDPANGCPKCGGALWDNRATKKNPKAPDYKCRDKACDGCIWPPKNGAPRAAAPAAPVKAAHSSGPNIQGLDDAPAPVNVNRLDALFTLYRTCFNEAASVAKGVPTGVQVTHEGIAAQAACLFIQANQRGLAA